MYFSTDLRLVIKTITHSEAKYLRKILYRYYHYMVSNPHTLLCKFCGMHRLQPRKGPKTYFVVMRNVFPAFLDTHSRFDLKGSSHGRTVGPQVLAMDDAARASAVLKDLDFVALGKKIRLGPTKAAIFKSQVRRDVEFLASIGVMDYSLLLGVHDLNISNSAKLRATLLERVTPTEPALADRAAIRAAGLKKKARRAAKTLLYKRPVLIQTLSTSDLPSLTPGQGGEASPDQAAFPATSSSAEPVGMGGMGRFTSVFASELGGLQSTDANDDPLSELYFLGIVDFLQNWTKKKKMENKYKSFRFDSKTISAIPPAPYASRFYNFVVSCILSDPDPPPEVVLRRPPPEPLRAQTRSRANSLNAHLLSGGRVVSVYERLDPVTGNIIRTSRIKRKRKSSRASSSDLSATATATATKDGKRRKRKGRRKKKPVVPERTTGPGTPTAMAAAKAGAGVGGGTFVLDSSSSGVDDGSTSYSYVEVDNVREPTGFWSHTPRTRGRMVTKEGIDPGRSFTYFHSEDSGGGGGDDEFTSSGGMSGGSGSGTTSISDQVAISYAHGDEVAECERSGVSSDIDDGSGSDDWWS